jgi:hypothetical protein
VDIPKKLNHGPDEIEELLRINAGYESSTKVIIKRLKLIFRDSDCDIEVLR